MELKNIFSSFLSPMDRKDVLYTDIADTLGEILDVNMPCATNISKLVTPTNIQLKNELLKIYLQNVVYSFNSALSDDTVVKKLMQEYAKLGMQYTPTLAIGNSAKDFSEYFYTSKEFKQSKGKKTGIEYAYNLVRKLKVQPLNDSDDIIDPVFSITEGIDTEPNKPFVFTVTGSLYKEVYESSVKPISHPVGFGYEYYRLLLLQFVDYVDMVVGYPDAVVKVNCSSGETTDFSLQTILNIIEDINEFGKIKVTIVFSNDTKLVKEVNGLVSLYKVSTNELIKAYPSSCALYLKYNPKLTTKIKEYFNIEFEDDFVEGVYCHNCFTIGNQINVGEFSIGVACVPSSIGGLCKDYFAIGDQYTVDGLDVGESLCTDHSIIGNHLVVGKANIREGCVDEGIIYSVIGNQLEINDFIIGGGLYVQNEEHTSSECYGPHIGSFIIGVDISTERCLSETLEVEEEMSLSDLIYDETEETISDELLVGSFTISGDLLETFEIRTVINQEMPILDTVYDKIGEIVRDELLVGDFTISSDLLETFETEQEMPLSDFAYNKIEKTLGDELVIGNFALSNNILETFEIRTVINQEMPISDIIYDKIGEVVSDGLVVGSFTISNDLLETFEIKQEMSLSDIVYDKIGEVVSDGLVVGSFTISGDLLETFEMFTITEENIRDELLVGSFMVGYNA